MQNPIAPQNNSPPPPYAYIPFPQNNFNQNNTEIPPKPTSPGSFPQIQLHPANEHVAAGEQTQQAFIPMQVHTRMAFSYISSMILHLTFKTVTRKKKIRVYFKLFYLCR